MLPVGEQPLLAHVADGAIRAGADELHFVVGYSGENIRDAFGAEHAGVPIEYHVQNEQRGTAHALQTAEAHLEGAFAVLNGDNYYDPADLERLFDAGPAIGVHEVSTPSNYGVVSIEGETVTDIVEKPETPPTQLANAGAYVFPETASEQFAVEASERGEQELTDVLARVIENTDISAVELAHWLDVGRPWELLEANTRFLEEVETELAGTVSDDATVSGSVVVEAGATVKSDVTLEGPVLIREGADVGPGAYVRGPAVVGPDAHVGHGVELKETVLMADSSVSHLSYVGDSLVGRGVNLGAGTMVANLRHDDQPVELTVQGERVSTGRRKFGVVIGDGVKTGINTTLYPGVSLSAGAHTNPGDVIRRDQ